MFYTGIYFILVSHTSFLFCFIFFVFSFLLSFYPFTQLSPVLNSCISYILCGALGYRILREKHKSLMWHEILAIGPAIGDVCIVVLFLFAIVRKGARRHGYVRYEAVLPGTELELGN